jgi:hypothetical protein
MTQFILNEAFADVANALYTFTTESEKNAENATSCWVVG